MASLSFFLEDPPPGKSPGFPFCPSSTRGVNLKATKRHDRKAGTGGVAGEIEREKKEESWAKRQREILSE